MATRSASSTSVWRAPVTLSLGAAATAVTLWRWSGGDVTALAMDYRAWSTEPWRLVTSALPHLGPIHLLFNLYWLWVFGTKIEQVLGSLNTAALMLLCAIASAAAEYAFARGGVGLSGIGYGLFGFCWVVRARDERFAAVIDPHIVQLFVGWFFLCIALTIVGVFRVANVAQ